MGLCRDYMHKAKTCQVGIGKIRGCVRLYGAGRHSPSEFACILLLQKNSPLRILSRPGRLISSMLSGVNLFWLFDDCCIGSLNKRAR